MQSNSYFSQTILSSNTSIPDCSFSINYPSDYPCFNYSYSSYNNQYYNYPYYTPYTYNSNFSLNNSSNNYQNTNLSNNSSINYFNSTNYDYLGDSYLDFSSINLDSSPDSSLSSPIPCSINNSKSPVVKHCNQNPINEQISPIINSNGPVKSKSKKTVSKKSLLSEQAVDIMNAWYDEHLNNPYPTIEEKERLANLGGITVKQVTAWFSNRRNRTQNTKPKRMKRVLEKDITDIYQELIQNSDNQYVIEKFNIIVNRHIGY